MELIETVIGSQEVYRGKIVHLRVDTVRLPNGHESKREIVQHRGAVCIVPVQEDGTILLVRQFRLAAGKVLAVKGDALDITPWTVALGAQYSFDLLQRNAFIRADYQYNSKRTTPTPAEDPNTGYYDPGLVPNPATSQMSLRGGINLGRWDLALFAENLFNAHPQLNLQHQDKFTLLYEAQTFRPRTVGIAASFRY